MRGRMLGRCIRMELSVASQDAGMWRRRHPRYVGYVATAGRDERGPGGCCVALTQDRGQCVDTGLCHLGVLGGRDAGHADRAEHFAVHDDGQAAFDRRRAA